MGQPSKVVRVAEEPFEVGEPASQMPFTIWYFGATHARQDDFFNPWAADDSKLHHRGRRPTLSVRLVHSIHSAGTAASQRRGSGLARRSTRPRCAAPAHPASTTVPMPGVPPRSGL